MGKKKYYVVWKGKKTGIFSSWSECKKQIHSYEGAQYKAFIDKKEAEIAFKKSYSDYKGLNTKKKVLSNSEKEKYGTPILESISVDAACAGNPGIMEYRGVLTHNKKEIFKMDKQRWRAEERLENAIMTDCEKLASEFQALPSSQNVVFQ